MGVSVASSSFLAFFTLEDEEFFCLFFLIFFTKTLSNDVFDSFGRPTLFTFIEVCQLRSYFFFLVLLLLAAGSPSSLIS